MLRLQELRDSGQGHPVLRFFLLQHDLRAVNRLAERYRQLALIIPEPHEFHRWLVATTSDLRAFAGGQPTDAVRTVARYLVKPLLWITGTGGVSVLGFQLSQLCLCYLAHAVAAIVPMTLGFLLVPAAREGRKLISDKSEAYEHRLGTVLQLRLRRDVPWDALFLIAAAAWFFVAPVLLHHLVTFNDIERVIGGCVGLAAIYALYEWVRNGGLGATYL